MASSVLLVVPTMGERIEFLAQVLASIAAQDEPADVVVVTPSTATRARELAAAHGARIVDDPGSLPGAINAGVATADPGHVFVNWIGDDDLLTAGSLAATAGALRADPGAVVAYGACDYVDDAGRRLWTSAAGHWAQRILGWGPDLIPQPGMLVRLDSWQRVGGVDPSLRFAFDLDLLLKLRALGGFVDVGQVVSCFRWHADSLTVSSRTDSLNESEAVKRRHLSPRARKVAWLWEQPVRWATRVAAHRVTSRARAAQRSSTAKVAG